MLGCLWLIGVLFSNNSKPHFLARLHDAKLAQSIVKIRYFMSDTLKHQFTNSFTAYTVYPFLWYFSYIKYAISTSFNVSSSPTPTIPIISSVSLDAITYLLFS